MSSSAHPGIHPYRGKRPQIHPTAFVAPGAQLIGDVTICEQASVWYNCVLRGDLGPIMVGARSNVQDGTVIHVEGPREGHAGPILPTLIGEDALIGHMAILHGCTVADRGFVGMGAIVMDRCIIGSDAILAAGALLPPGKAVPDGELWTGRPARHFRTLAPVEISGTSSQTQHYIELAAFHRESQKALPDQMHR